MNAPDFTLVVTPTGTGTVTSDVPGIACPPTCSMSFDQGTLVTLHAEAGDGMIFGGWTGACRTTRDSCTVTMDGGRGADTCSGGATTSNCEG